VLCAQRVGENPLVLGQWIEGGGTGQRAQGLCTLPLREQDASLREQRGGVVTFALQRCSDGIERLGRPAGLQLVQSHACVGPRRRLGIAGAGRRHRLTHRLQGAIEIALHPAHVSGAGIGLIERLQIDHPLVGGGRLFEPSLFHQDVAEQTEVEHDRAPGDELTRDRLGLGESMQLVQHMAAQQQRRRFVGV
jgi:hypothetical protein